MIKRSLILTAFLCTQFPNISIAQNNARANFLPLNVAEFISNNSISVSNPGQVARQLFNNTEVEQEAIRSEEISVSYPTRQTAAIVYTRVGIADDSVDGIRQRIELRLRQNKWEIIWIGQQTRCKRNRGHQNWMGRRCL